MMTRISSRLLRFKNKILGTKTLTLQVNNISFLVNIKDNSDEWYDILKNKSWNEEVGYAIQASLEESDSFIDIGSFFGKMTLIGAKSVGINGKVFSFDPDPYCIEGLKDNIELNNLENVLVFQSAIGSSNGKVSLDVSKGLGSSQNSIISNNYNEPLNESLIVKQYTLDYLINRYSILPKLIKIDAEGAEHEIYLGSKDYFLKKTPNIIMELHRKIISESKLKELYHWFSHYRHIILLDDLLDISYFAGDEVDIKIIKETKRSGFNFLLTNDSKLSKKVQKEICGNKSNV